MTRLRELVEGGTTDRPFEKFRGKEEERLQKDYSGFNSRHQREDVKV